MKVCSHQGCARKAKARGMCQMHYYRMWRTDEHLDAPLRRTVPSLGTVRRLQALIAMGHTERQITALLGRRGNNLTTIVHGHRAAISPATRDAVSRVFDELWDQRPEGWVHDRNRHLASLRGWVPPLGWDDIDHDAAPAVAETAQSMGERILEDVEWLLDAGESPELILTTLGRSADAVAKLADRHGRRDLARPFETIRKAAA